MFTITMYNNDNGGVAWVEDYNNVEDFKDALTYYGADYDGDNEVVLIL